MIFHQVEREREREREREQNHSTKPHKTSWEDTPTPNVEKTFNFSKPSSSQAKGKAKQIYSENQPIETNFKSNQETISTSDEETESPTIGKTKSKPFLKKLSGLTPVRKANYHQKKETIADLQKELEKTRHKLKIANENNENSARPLLEKVKNLQSLLEETNSNLKEDQEAYEQAIIDLNEQLDELGAELAQERESFNLQKQTLNNLHKILHDATQETIKRLQEQANKDKLTIQNLKKTKEADHGWKTGYWNLYAELKTIYAKLIKELEQKLNQPKITELEEETDNEEFFDASETSEEEIFFDAMEPNEETTQERTAPLNNRTRQIPTNPNYYLKKHWGKAVAFGLGYLANYYQNGQTGQITPQANWELANQTYYSNSSINFSPYEPEFLISNYTASLQEELVAERYKMKYLFQQNQSLQTQIDTQKSQDQQIIKDLQKQLASTKKQLKSKKEQKDTELANNLTSANQDKTTQINELKTKLANQNNLTRENENLRVNLTQKQREISQLHQNFTNLQTSQETSEKSWQEKQTNYEKTLKNFEEQLGKQKKTHQQELSAEQQKSQQAQTQLQAQTAINQQKEQTIQRLQANLTETKNQLNQIKIELHQTQTDKELLLQGIDGLYQQHQTNLNQIQQLNIKITNYEQASEQQEQSIKGLITELNTAKIEAKEKQENLTTQSTNALKSVNDLQEQNSHLNQTIADYQNQLKVKEDELQKTIQKNYQLNYQLTSWVEDVGKYWKKTASLQQENNHTCPHGDYDSLKQEVANKDQKISELETQLQEKDKIIAELRNKPPVSPVNNQESQSKNNSQSEPNNFSANTEELLKTIQQQQETIRELQTQITNQKIKEVIKEIPMKDLTVIQHLQDKIKDKENNLTQLRWLLFISAAVIILLGLNTVKLLARKTKSKRN